MAALFVACAVGFAPNVLHRPALVHTRTATVKAGLVDAVKDQIVPANSDKTLRNAVGFQAFAWGLAGVAVPTYLSTNVIGVTASAASNTLLRGMSIANLNLAGRITGGSDADAAQTGAIWFALWWWALSNAVKAGTYAGPHMATIVTWNAIMALVCARRNGGIWSTVTSADTSLLSSLLPRDYERSTRNFVGMQATAWGVAGLFFPAFLFSTLGLASTPAVAALVTGNAITNLVLGGKVMGGSDDAAAATGVTFFGAWAVLGFLAKGAGVFTGQYVSLLTLWNAAAAIFCASKLV